MTPLKVLLFAGACVFAVVLAIHGLHASPFLMAAAETGDTQEQYSYKIRALIKSLDGKDLDVLVLKDHEGHVVLWKTRGECEAFQQTAEFQDIVPRLADYMRAHGWYTAQVTFGCFPVDADSNL
jgi:hypothetical protein